MVEQEAGGLKVMGGLQPAQEGIDCSGEGGGMSGSGLLMDGEKRNQRGDRVEPAIHP